ncbi:MAG: sulfite exporter TauE/SafE family protein [Anaerolineae bacterium]|nr:sulfite exporter TauE/SafE family protein [Anaerolineae bacterium]
MPIALFILGFVAGIASGMFGIGGGVIIVPVLVTVMGFALQRATGTSLGALLMPVGLFAVMEYYRAEKINIRAAAWIAVGLILGAIAGANIAVSLPSDTLRQIYGVFLLYASWRFVEPRKWLAEMRNQKTVAAAPEEPRNMAWYWFVVLGVIAGIASGMFGIGGGVIIVPALVGLLKFDQKTAAGTSLATLLLPVSLGGAIVYYQNGLLEVGVAAPVAIGLIVGAFAGARIALGLPSKTIKRIYGIFLFFVGIYFIFRDVLFLAATR